MATMATGWTSLNSSAPVYVHVTPHNVSRPSGVLPARTLGLFFRRTNPALQELGSQSLLRGIKQKPVGIHLVASTDEIDTALYSLSRVVFSNVDDPAIKDTARRFSTRFLALLARIEQAAPNLRVKENAARAFLTTHIAEKRAYVGRQDALYDAFAHYLRTGKLDFQVNKAFLEACSVMSAKMRMEWGAKAAVRSAVELTPIAETLVATMRGKVFVT